MQDISQEEEEKEEGEQVKVAESIDGKRDLATKEMASTTGPTQEDAKAKALEKHEQLCEISQALAVLASASVRKTNFIIAK